MEVSKLNLRQNIGYQLVRAGRAIAGLSRVDKNDFVRDLIHGIKFNNPFTAGLYRYIKGEWRLHQMTQGFNDVTTEGKNTLWDTFFGKGTPLTQIDPWYIGLVNNSPAPTFAAADTLASHAGWSEFTTYTGNRQAWIDADSASGIKGTTTVSTFPITTGGVVNGILVASIASGTGGKLWATGSFDETVTVIISDSLKITYGVRA